MNFCLFLFLNFMKFSPGSDLCAKFGKFFFSCRFQGTGYWWRFIQQGAPAGQCVGVGSEDP